MGENLRGLRENLKHKNWVLVLNDGVIFDVRMGREVKKLDKLNQNLNGVFHPNGLEILSKL